MDLDGRSPGYLDLLLVLELFPGHQTSQFPQHLLLHQQQQEPKGPENYPGSLAAFECIEASGLWQANQHVEQFFSQGDRSGKNARKPS